MGILEALAEMLNPRPQYGDIAGQLDRNNTWPQEPGVLDQMRMVSEAQRDMLAHGRVSAAAKMAGEHPLGQLAQSFVGPIMPAFKGMNAYLDSGLPVDITKGRAQHDWSKNVQNAGFFSSNPDVASYFANVHGSRAGAAVYPVKLDFKNPLILDGTGKHARDFQFGAGKERWQDYFTSPKYADYDGVIIRNVEDVGGTGDIYVPRHPAQIAPRFGQD